jgi:hypothetical protein
MERITGSRCQLKSIVQDVENVMPVEKAHGAGICCFLWGLAVDAVCQASAGRAKYFFVLPNGASDFGGWGLAS